MDTKTNFGIALWVLFFSSACSEKQPVMTAEVLPNGQYVICESGTHILQYNYQIVYEQDVVRSESQKVLGGRKLNMVRNAVIHTHYRAFSLALQAISNVLTARIMPRLRLKTTGCGAIRKL